MLFLRCFHRRLCRVLFHEFHTTRPCLRESLDTFQIDPNTARAIFDLKLSSPGRSRSKSNSRKTKTLRAGKQSKEKSDRTECFSDSDMLSSRLRLYNRRVRCSRTVGRQSSPSAPTEREAHLGASENAGGSSCPFHAVLFHLLPSTVRSKRLLGEYTPTTQPFTVLT
jgi:hypothetical protein